MEQKLIPKKVLKSAMNQMELSDQERALYDNAVMITRRALGIPLQLDMFE